jgi:hypothetical protein
VTATQLAGVQQLASAVTFFNVQHRRLTNALNVGHALSEWAKAEVIALGLDARDACVLLGDLYGGAFTEFVAEHAALSADSPQKPSPPAAG